MENKYFTPSIEDLRVGYECEKTILDFSSTGSKSLGWEKYIVGQDGDWDKGLREMSSYVFWSTKYLRVPYLTKEQIEAEGWIFVGQDTLKRENGDYITASLDFKHPESGFIVRLFNSEDHLIQIYKPLPEHHELKRILYFNGCCKDINTFRYIIKLLGI